MFFHCFIFLVFCSFISLTFICFFCFFTIIINFFFPFSKRLKLVIILMGYGGWISFFLFTFVKNATYQQQQLYWNSLYRKKPFIIPPCYFVQKNLQLYRYIKLSKISGKKFSMTSKLSTCQISFFFFSNKLSKYKMLPRKSPLQKKRIYTMKI